MSSDAAFHSQPLLVSPAQQPQPADASASLAQGEPRDESPSQQHAQAPAATAVAESGQPAAHLPVVPHASASAAASDERKEVDEASSSSGSGAPMSVARESDAAATPAAASDSLSGLKSPPASVTLPAVAAAPAAVTAAAASESPAAVAEDPAADTAPVVRIHIGAVDDESPVQVRASSHSHDEEKLNGSVELQRMHAAASAASPAPPSAASSDVSAVDARPSDEPVMDVDADAGPVHLITIDNFRAKPLQQVAPKPSYTAATFPTVAPIRAAAAHAHNSTLDTLTVAPTSKRALLKTVPNEVLSLMLTYLDAKSLVQFGLTSSVHNSLSCKKSLWMSLLSQPWHGYDHAGQPIKGVKMDTHTKGYYAARRLYALDQRRQKLRDHKRALVRVRQNHRAWWCLLLTDFAFSPCIGALATIFLICLVWQLVRHESVGFLTLWPLLAIGALIALVATILCCTKYFEMLHGMLPGNFYDHSHGPLKGLMEIIGEGESRWGHASFCFMSAVLGLFLVFLCLRIEGSLIQWNWWVVFSPLYVVFAMWCCAPCFRWPATSYIKIEPCVGVWCLLGLPLLAFVILLNLKLVNWGVFGFWAVMIPLWSMDLMALATAVVIAVGDMSCAMIFAWVVFDGPLMVFKLLLTLRLDREMSTWTWAYVFIPLYLVQLMLFCGSLAIVWAVADDGGIEWEDEPDEPHLPLPPV